MRRLVIVFSALATVVCGGCVAREAATTGIDAVGDIFLAEGVTATLVVASVDGHIVITHNAERSVLRFSPASTFKIPNTLIALDSGIVDSRSSIFTWDGVDRGIESWNRDQTLATAFKVSCVWCYQEIARKVGAEKYTEELAALDYGNQSIGGQVDSFWLDGSLKISAVEQIAFLRRLYNHELPFQAEHIEILRQIMVTRATEQYTIYAKTGWATTSPQVAWYVGFVESAKGPWLFAMNMRVDRPEQAKLREELSLRSLRALGII